MLENDNFADNSTHEPKKNWRRIKMNKELFMKIVIGVWGYDDYFHYKKNSTRLPRFTSVQMFINNFKII
jgi:hypothetical protein